MSDSRSSLGGAHAPGNPTVAEPVYDLATEVDLTESTFAEYPSDAIDDLIVVPELTIIIPMFRESTRIAQTVKTLASSPLNRDDIAFVFVDDGSCDDTADVTWRSIAEEGLRNASVQSLATNLGKGGAVKAGMSIAKGRYLGFVDADLSLDPADVSRALARVASTGAHIVVGERVVNPLHQPKLRRLFSTVFRRLVWGLSGLQIADPQCALKIFRADAAAVLFGALTTNGFAFDVEVLTRAVQRGYRIEEMKIRWEHQPGSKVNPVSDGMRMYRELLRIRRILGS